jgi:transposase InsO family protein
MVGCGSDRKTLQIGSSLYARRIVGWRTSRTAHASFVVDALEQVLMNRQPRRRPMIVAHLFLKLIRLPY